MSAGGARCTAGEEREKEEEGEGMGWGAVMGENYACCDSAVDLMDTFAARVKSDREI